MTPEEISTRKRELRDAITTLKTSVELLEQRFYAALREESDLPGLKHLLRDRMEQVTGRNLNLATTYASLTNP